MQYATTQHPFWFAAKNRRRRRKYIPLRMPASYAEDIGLHTVTTVSFISCKKRVVLFCGFLNVIDVIPSYTLF